MATSSDGGCADPRSSEDPADQVDQREQYDVKVDSSTLHPLGPLHHDEFTDVGLHEKEQVEEQCRQNRSKYRPDFQRSSLKTEGRDHPTSKGRIRHLSIWCRTCLSELAIQSHLKTLRHQKLFCVGVLSCKGHPDHAVRDIFNFCV